MVSDFQSANISNKPQLSGIYNANRVVSQMRALVEACRKLAVDYNWLPYMLYIF